MSYSQTTRYRLPGSLMFLQTSGLCGSEEESGGLAARQTTLFDVLRRAVRRGSSRSGSSWRNRKHAGIDPRLLQACRLFVKESPGIKRSRNNHRTIIAVRAAAARQ